MATALTTANVATTRGTCAVEAPAVRQPKIVELVPAGQIALDLTLPDGPNLSDEDRIEAEKRFAVIEPLIDRQKFRLLFLQCHNRAGEVTAFLASQHGTKRRTLYEWLHRWQQSGIAGLVRRDRRDKGQPRQLNSAAMDFLLAAALPNQGSYGELSVAEIYRAYQEERAWRAAHAGKVLGEFGEGKYFRYLDGSGRLAARAQLPPASYETMRSWFNRIPEVVKVLGREGQEAFSNTQEVISFRNLAVIQPLDYVVMDHRRLDIFCLLHERGGWKLGRPWITCAIDMRTRRWLAHVIVENPSSDSIASVLKRVFIDHGVPSAVLWDHGKDFVCQWLEGGNLKRGPAERVLELNPGMRGVLETLGVRVHHAIVRRARAKLIEPAFLATALCDKSLPWWCGHTPSARPERFDDLVRQHERWVKGEVAETPFKPIEEIAALYHEFLASLNERPHSGEGMRKIMPEGLGWLSPNECFDKLIGRVQRRTVPAEVLQFAFQKRRALKVRNGELRCTFGGRQFHFRLADSSLGLMALNGFEVELAYDPFDLERAAVYHRDRFVGLVQNVELRRMGESAFVADERDRRAARREVRRFITAVHQQIPVAGTEERLNRRAAVRPARTEPARVEVPLAVPESIVAASEAAADRAFSFAAVGDGAAVIRCADRAAYEDDDSEFRLFREER